MAKGKYQEWLTPDNLLRLESWARDGLTDEQIANNMGINVATLYRWKDQYCEICESLKRGKDVVDMEVENALLKRALGYTFTETTSESRYNRETGKYEMCVVKSVTKEVQPDTTAQIFWLKNRRPDIWRDRQDLNVSAQITEEKSKLDEILEMRRQAREMGK